ncbi:myosin heavy chain, clone 203-like [Mytilus edulis]|uniref:myosin heavy chain, clone 203-like n=1 Tax=Mytilus edulis TaxID=6550 RepID=UPI0039EE685A
MYTDKDDHEYPDRSEKLLNEKRRECVVDMKSNGGKQTKNPQGQICTCVWIKKWKWKVFFGIIAVCSIVSVALSLYKMANLSLDEKEISSMKKDILDMKQQRKKFENDIRLLYAGHYDQNDNLDTLETVLQNITATFNERINNLTTELNTLNTEYERQVKLQEDMQKQIDAMGTENRKKFEEFNQKMIVMKQNLNDMTASQEVLKNDLRDAQNSSRRETQNAVDRIRNDFRAAQHKLESDYRETRNSQNELKASQQSLRSMLLGKLSDLKRHVQSKPNAGPITRSSVGLIFVLLFSIRLFL